MESRVHAALSTCRLQKICRRPDPSSLSIYPCNSADRSPQPLRARRRSQKARRRSIFDGARQMALIVRETLNTFEPRARGDLFSLLSRFPSSPPSSAGTVNFNASALASERMMDNGADSFDVD